MLATVKPSNRQSRRGGREDTTRLGGGELLAKPDVAVFQASLVLALGETKTERAQDACVRLLCVAEAVFLTSAAMCPARRHKLACMSAAACGCLQLKIRETDKQLGLPTATGKCHCGRHEALFPIPLIESYCNVVRLYYGKTVHDEASTCGFVDCLEHHTRAHSRRVSQH